jgi:biopolymer transport protein ExbD
LLQWDFPHRALLALERTKRTLGSEVTMAGSSYEDEDSITNINVTPFVDVVLVLLVIFMVTAKLIVARGVHIDKPKAAAGGEVASSLRISVVYLSTANLSSTMLVRSQRSLQSPRRQQLRKPLSRVIERRHTPVSCAR